MNRSSFCAVAAGLALALFAVPATASAGVHPGAQTFTKGAQCTSNFVFRDGSSTYLGQAAHCSGTGAATETDGCDSESLPLGTPVRIDGAKRPGKLAYNSWIAMQHAGETNDNTCAYNDLALVKLSAADAATVKPTVPGFGGPEGLGPSGAGLGDTVYSYGNSSLRGGVTTLSPKQGVVVQSEGNGWSRTVYTLTPGVPGDSGSGFMNESGKAIGTLSTLAVAPAPASNGVADLRKELNYLNHSGVLGKVQLVPGTKPFNPDLGGAILGA